MPFVLPVVASCCVCVTDLKSAVAIIAVLGIVTSPAVSWTVVKHSYVIRVSCFLTTSKTRRDILDINLNNIVSFGLGANAGLEPSCLGQPVVGQRMDIRTRSGTENSSFFTFVHYFGWFVLMVDLIFLLVSVIFLAKIFQNSIKLISLVFMSFAALSSVLSFSYGMMYVTACMKVGGAFPIFEFLFCAIDVFMWAYFIIVVNSYVRGGGGGAAG